MTTLRFTLELPNGCQCGGDGQAEAAAIDPTVDYGCAPDCPPDTTSTTTSTTTTSTTTTTTSTTTTTPPPSVPCATILNAINFDTFGSLSMVLNYPPGLPADCSGSTVTGGLVSDSTLLFGDCTTLNDVSFSPCVPVFMEPCENRLYSLGAGTTYEIITQYFVDFVEILVCIKPDRTIDLIAVVPDFRPNYPFPFTGCGFCGASIWTYYNYPGTIDAFGHLTGTGVSLSLTQPCGSGIVHPSSLSVAFP